MGFSAASHENLLKQLQFCISGPQYTSKNIISGIFPCIFCDFCMATSPAKNLEQMIIQAKAVEKDYLPVKIAFPISGTSSIKDLKLSIIQVRSKESDILPVHFAFQA